MTAPARFVTRPREVLAMRYTSETCRALHDWAGCKHPTPHDCGGEPATLFMCTVTPGCWLVDRAGRGRRVLVRWQCIPDDEFRERYEPAPESEP